MKRLLTIFIFLVAFTAANAQDEQGWENWQQTSCYNKISYRMKYAGKNGSQHHWKIQFKNDYSGVVSFNYNITDKLQEYNITTHRKVLYGGKISEVIDVYQKEEDIYLIVDKLSLSPYPDDIEECDNN